MNNLIFVPIGSYEQHGPHLPLDTDYLIAEEITRKASQIFKGKTIQGIRIGISNEHQGFLKTKSISPEEFTSQIKKIIHKSQKNEKIIFINAHSGNTNTLNSIQLLKEKKNLVINTFSIIKEDLKVLRTSNIGGICHAGEFETSVMLYLYPEMVRMEKLKKADVTYVPALDPNYLDEKLKNWKTVDFCESGVLGDPFHATMDKGKIWFNRIIERIKLIIEDFIHLAV